ncbi:MAG: PilT/PilU family type 4a pilus ATPase [Phycisphaeraceae bacterium]|nr:PilT/PilU family type 4a pilus ATPase [Phycisphaeraceae bacterium]
MPDSVGGAFTIHRLLEAMGRLGASDLHIKVGIPPTYRVNGILRPVQGDPLTEDEADHIVDPIFPEKLRARFESEGGVDFATFVKDDRFRCNVYRSGGHINAAIRRVKSDIPTYEALHLPPIYNDIVEKTNEGLVLVCGVTGSGKSTTLAAMIEHINKKEACNIITIEDPVEYRFSRARSIVSQREIGIDVPGYPQALRSIVRQDPDVIFIGEMRDHDTVLAAIQAAETGHLVFGSLHTADTMQSFNRILEFFPKEEHGFIRSALATSMRAVCAQRLLPALPEVGVGMVPATEVLLNTAIVREKIRDGFDEDIPSIINASIHEGMRSMTYSLAELVKAEMVAVQTAMAFAPNQSALDSALKGVEVKAQTLVHRVRAAGKGS